MNADERFTALMNLSDDQLLRIVTLLLSFDEAQDQPIYHRPLIGGQRLNPLVQDGYTGGFRLIPA